MLAAIAGESGALADSIQALDLRRQGVIAEVVAETAATEDCGTLTACFCMAVAEVAGAIGALCDRVPAAVFTGIVSGMPTLEYVAGSHRPQVYSGISLTDRGSVVERAAQTARKMMGGYPTDSLNWMRISLVPPKPIDS